MLVKDGNFWIPLIGIYSGMRLGEIVQLLVLDLTAEEGAWYFNIDEREGETKRFKTASSRRRVPVHTELIKLGLLSYRAARHESEPQGRLFPDILPGKDGYASHNFSKSFGRYLKQVGVKTPKTSFHSFRHNFKDALDFAGVEESRRRALMGHADGSTHAGYGSRLPVAALASDVNKIAYSIDLSKLHVKEAGVGEMNDKAQGEESST
jgi:integrase